MKNEITILLDYKNSFWCSPDRYDISIDKDYLQKCFNDFDYEIKYQRFTDINFRRENYRNKYILYQSSEDINQIYKSFIDDILFALKLQGARLIPDYHLFKAHHNKIFMEILRDLSDIEEIKNIESNYFGTIEELVNKIEVLDKKLVIKGAETQKSKGVMLAKSHKQAIEMSKDISNSFNLSEYIKQTLKYYLQRPYIKDSLHRKKFVTQSFVENLGNDYKVLIFGKKHYILYRGVKKNDFRASGSGIFNWPHEGVEGVLNFANKVYKSLQCPCVNMDIGFDGENYYLFEFQALHFGPTALVKSPRYFYLDGSEWKKIEEKSIMEIEFARCIVDFIEREKHL